jgi:hypothetical protein
MNDGILSQGKSAPIMPLPLTVGSSIPLLTPRGFIGSDSDAISYINRVETADNARLEPAVKLAITQFIIGCKTDGIWNAIKASCILMGARTLSGALVPLVGSSPTNVNFVSGDYVRYEGLTGNGVSKYLNSNRNVNADSITDHHCAAYVKTPTSTALLGSVGLGTAMGGRNPNGNSIGSKRLVLTNSQSRCIFQTASAPNTDNEFNSGDYTMNTYMFGGIARNRDNLFESRSNNRTTTVNSLISASPVSATLFIFAFNEAGSPNPATYYPNAIAFYSIGQYLNLANLDTRVTILFNTLNTILR